MRRFSVFASGLFACVTGCGDDGVNKLPDAPPAPEDSGIDAAVTGTANITTNVRCCDVAPGTPQAGVTIAVLHADHTLGATATSDAQGKASVPVRVGDSVFAIYPESQFQRTAISTYVGVKPGDNLTFGESFVFSVPGTGVAGQITATWAAVPNATTYIAYSPCGGYSTNTTSIVLDLTPTCQSATAPMLFVARDVNSTLLASAYLPAAPFVPGDTVNVTWTSPPPTFTVSVSGLDAATQQAFLGVQSVFPKVIDLGGGLYPPLSGGAGMTVVTTPAGATRYVSSAQLRRFTTNGRQYYAKTSPSPVAFTPTIPWVNGIAANPSEGQVVWLQSAGGTYDATTLFFNWSRSDGKALHYYVWDVIAPPGVTRLDFGAPPPALAAYLPDVRDSVRTSVALVDLSTTTTYDEVRALPEGTTIDLEYAVYAGTVPAGGVSSLDSGEGFVPALQR